VALALVSLAATAPSSSPHGLNRHDFLITHGRWWDGTKFVPRDRVYTVAGELRATWSGAVEDTIDLGDRCVLPPFSDAHTHLLSDTAMFAPNLRALLGAGVLYAQNPNNPGSRVAAVRERLARPGTLEMTFANGGLTAPGGHPAQIYDPAGAGGERPRSGDAYWEIADAADLAAKWSRVLAAKPDLIKAYLEHSEVHAERVAAKAYGRYGLDPRLLPEVVSRAHAAKLRVAVHVNSAEDFHVAVESGADEIAHLPLAPITPADAAQAAKRGVTVVTTLVSHRPTEGIAGLDRIERDNVRLLRRAGVKLALGTDHPVKTVAEEAAELVRIGAVTNQEVIRLLTHDTFEAIFPSRKPAQLRIGDEASFVVLEADPVAEIANLKKVAWCMKQGYHVELPALPSTKPGIADSLAPLLMRGDLEGALALDQRLRSEPHQELDCGEQQLNGLGYKLLQHGAKTPAVAIFRRNAEVFPRSANVYDSLADAYLATSDTTAAVGAYRKVLEVLPENPKYAPEYRAGLEARAKDFIAKHERRE
jgi:imidazolonepropionase-like amidohydrolase